MRGGSERFWANPAGGSFHEGTNWDPEGAPGALDIAKFEMGGTSLTITFSQNVTNQILSVDEGDVTFDNMLTYSLDEVIVGADLREVALLCVRDGTLSVQSEDPLREVGALRKPDHDPIPEAAIGLIGAQHLVGLVGIRMDTPDEQGDQKSDPGKPCSVHRLPNQTPTGPGPTSGPLAAGRVPARQPGSLWHKRGHGGRIFRRILSGAQALSFS